MPQDRRSSLWQQPLFTTISSSSFVVFQRRLSSLHGRFTQEKKLIGHGERLFGLDKLDKLDNLGPVTPSPTGHLPLSLALVAGTCVCMR